MTDETAMKPAPIKTAEKIGKDCGAQRVAILLLDGAGNYAWTTWGKTKADCDALRRWGDAHAVNALVGMNEE